MGFRLTPQDTSFYDCFATSASHLVDGAAELTAMLTLPVDGREASARRMKDHEHAADESTHALMSKVNSSFITPFDREDIYDLASNLDDCMDHMEAAVDLIVLYQIDDLPPGIWGQVEALEQMATLTAEAMPRLRSMRDLAEYWIEINRLENEADRIYRRMLAELFSNGTDAITILKLKDVIDEFEDAADAFETVANTVESIAAKES